MAVLFFWPSDWSPVAWNVLPAPSHPLELPPSSVFSLFNSLFTSLFLLFLSPNRCFHPSLLGGECKVAEPFAFRGAVGMEPGSAMWGSKCSQLNHSFLSVTGVRSQQAFYCLKNHLLRLDSGCSAFVTLDNAWEEGKELSSTVPFHMSPSARRQDLWGLVERAEGLCPMLHHDLYFTRSHHVSELPQQPLPWTLWEDCKWEENVVGYFWKDSWC